MSKYEKAQGLQMVILFIVRIIFQRETFRFFKCENIKLSSGRMNS